MNTLIKAAKEVINIYATALEQDCASDLQESIEALRQAVQEAVSIPDLDDIAYQCDQHGDWVVDLHEVKAIVNRLSNPYTPMTDDELMEIDIKTGMADKETPWTYERNIERAVIERLGLVWGE